MNVHLVIIIFLKTQTVFVPIECYCKLLKSNNITDDNIHLKYGADAYIKTPQEMWFAMTWGRF